MIDYEKWELKRQQTDQKTFVVSGTKLNDLEERARELNDCHWGDVEDLIQACRELEVTEIAPGVYEKST